MLNEGRETIFIEFNIKELISAKVKWRNLKNLKKCRAVPTRVDFLSKLLIMLMKRHLNVNIGYFNSNFIVFTQVTCKIINKK